MSTTIVCSRKECSYNRADRCTATVIGMSEEKGCDTFYEFSDELKAELARLEKLKNKR